MTRRFAPRLFFADAAARLAQMANIDPGDVIEDFASAPGLETAEVLITGWGCPPIDEQVLRRAPELRAIVHTGGTVKEHVTDACWARGIAVSSAAEANAMPVAEYTVAAILFMQKHVLELSASYRARRQAAIWDDLIPDLGNYGRVVGIIGASRIGRRVVELLRAFDMELLVADPYLGAEEAHSVGARLVDLDELLTRADTVSLHAPSLPETRHLLDRRRLGLLRDGATLLNTARGALVDMDALTDELLSGRIRAVIDVTTPEVLPPGSVLYDLPNVLLTPHIAGSQGNELGRLGQHAVAELARYASGLPFRFAVHPLSLNRSA